MTTPWLEQDLKRFEGLRLVSYQDTDGVWTIGYGHTGAGVQANMRWPLEHAQEMLTADIARAIAALDKQAVWWRNLSDVRQDVIAMMAFQLGIRGVLNFVKTIQAIRSGDFVLAAEEMLDSDWEKQTPYRAKRLAEQMKTGERDELH